MGISCSTPNDILEVLAQYKIIIKLHIGPKPPQKSKGEAETEK